MLFNFIFGDRKGLFLLYIMERGEKKEEPWLECRGPRPMASLVSLWLSDLTSHRIAVGFWGLLRGSIDSGTRNFFMAACLSLTTSGAIMPRRNSCALEIGSMAFSMRLLLGFGDSGVLSLDVVLMATGLCRADQGNHLRLLDSFGGRSMSIYICGRLSFWNNPVTCL